MFVTNSRITNDMRIETIAEQLYFTTILIESQNDSGETGFGTGFLIDAVHESRHAMFLATNKHVVAGGKTGTLRFHLKAAGIPCQGQGYKLKVPCFAQYWVKHPDPTVDIAIMSMSLILEHAKKDGKELFYRSIPESLLPSNDELEKLDAMEEVVFIGYPSGIFDEAHYLPVARRGMTASPIQVNHNGERRFLIDAAIFGGSSGSPVFIFDKGGIHSKRGGGLVLGSRPSYFIGVVAAGYYQETTGRVIQQPIPTITGPLVSIGQQMINLGIVYRADTVFELAHSLMK